MSKVTLLKITQLVFGTITSLGLLYGSLVISLLIEHFSPFIIILFAIPASIIYFMMKRKYALFTTGLIIGILGFFTFIFVLFQDIKLH